MDRSKFSGTFGLLVVSIVFVVSCSNNDDPTGPDPNTPFPHAVPPAMTMQLDLSDLSSGDLLSSTGVCHGLSAFIVTWANLNVIVRLAIPVAAFGATISETPVYLGDDTWRWTANGGIGANAWTAELEATQTGESQIAWSMRISGTAANHDRFLWFDGESDLESRSGSWHYYDPQSPETPTELVRCVWSLPQGVGEDRQVTFENRNEESPEFGDRLQYQLAGATASVAYDDASMGARTTIEWDAVSGAGRLTNAQGETCCWGERPSFQDIPCGAR